MVRYLVGEGTDRPSLTEAINAASDGDTIELESGYCPTVDKVNVNKSLNFIGHVTKLMPWIRTLMGRIEKLESSNPQLKKKFDQDMEQLYSMYFGEAQNDIS